MMFDGLPPNPVVQIPDLVTFWSTYPTLSASNTFTVHFSPSTNNPVFYKIVATNAP